MADVDIDPFGEHDTNQGLKSQLMKDFFRSGYPRRMGPHSDPINLGTRT